MIVHGEARAAWEAIAALLKPGDTKDNQLRKLWAAQQAITRLSAQLLIEQPPPPFVGPVTYAAALQAAAHPQEDWTVIKA